MSADANQTLDIRLPSAAVASGDNDADAEGDAVTPLPAFIPKTFDMGIPVYHPGKRSNSVPGPSSPKHRLSRKSNRSAVSFDSGISPDFHQRPPPPPATITSSPVDEDYIVDHCWAKERDPFVFEPARIQIKPEVRPASITEGESHPSYTAARCANERLDRYMVIRQRSFHGLARSKKELRTLPLTDPREILAEDHPSWVHRSKTDLYIERRRARLRSQQSNREKSSSVDLNGMTFGNLMDNLPAPRPEFLPHQSKTSKTLSSSSPGFLSPNQDQMYSSNSSSSGEGDCRLPPLSLNKMKQMMQSDIETFNIQDATNVDEDLFRTASVDYPPTPRGLRGRGRLRKKPLVVPTAVPLRVWEPSFDYVVVSNSKMLTPRSDNSRTFPVRDTRQHSK